MKTKTIESLQQRLKAKGFNPGLIDGIDGPWTFIGEDSFAQIALEPA
jgi:hypothetical protein